MNSNKLLERINLEIPFQEYIDEIENNYPNIGTVQNYSPILQGYEDANFILNTSEGKYVLKIFSKDRTEKNIRDYIKIIEEARKIGVQTLEIIPCKENPFYLHNETYSMITRFFEGKSFLFTKPSLEDMYLVTENISKLNTIDFDTEESYDSWGSRNLVNEYEKSKLIHKDVKKEISPLIRYLREQDFSNFSEGVIHGDMQRQHVIKNNKDICILDYGCARRDYIIYEVSIFLAWFCLTEDTWDNRDVILEKVVNKYTETNSLSTKEKYNIKPLIAASYAAYFLKTSELIENGDNSKQTVEWNNSSKEMFKKCMNWIRL